MSDDTRAAIWLTPSQVMTIVYQTVATAIVVMLFMFNQKKEILGEIKEQKAEILLVVDSKTKAVKDFSDSADKSLIASLKKIEEYAFIKLVEENSKQDDKITLLEKGEIKRLGELAVIRSDHRNATTVITSSLDKLESAVDKLGVKMDQLENAGQGE